MQLNADSILDIILPYTLIALIFPPRQWKMHDVTLANQPRPNNVLEWRNNKFQALVGHNPPTVWKRVECIQAEGARVQDERGLRPKNRTKNVYVEVQIRLHCLCEDRAPGRKSISGFLWGVSHNLRWSA